MLATLDCSSLTIALTIASPSAQPLQGTMLRLVIVVSRFVATNPGDALESLNRHGVALIVQELDQSDLISGRESLLVNRTPH